MAVIMASPSTTLLMLVICSAITGERIDIPDVSAACPPEYSLSAEDSKCYRATDMAFAQEGQLARGCRITENEIFSGYDAIRIAAQATGNRHLYTNGEPNADQTCFTWDEGSQSDCIYPKPGASNPIRPVLNANNPNFGKDCIAFKDKSKKQKFVRALCTDKCPVMCQLSECYKDCPDKYDFGPEYGPQVQPWNANGICYRAPFPKNNMVWMTQAEATALCNVKGEKVLDDLAALVIAAKDKNTGNILWTSAKPSKLDDQDLGLGFNIMRFDSGYGDPVMNGVEYMKDDDPALQCVEFKFTRGVNKAKYAKRNCEDNCPVVCRSCMRGPE